MNYLKVNGRDQHPTSTVLQSRTPMFLPIKAVSKNFKKTDIEITNRYGTIVLADCKLTQVHRDIVDTIFSYYQPTRLAGGGVAFKFKVYDLFKKLNYKSVNAPWLFKKLDEMRKASIQLIIENDKVRSVDAQGVITRHKEVTDKETGEVYYGVMFSSNFVKLFEVDKNIYSQELTHDILNLKHGVTKALVRLVISNDKVNTSLKKLLSELGVRLEEKEGMIESERDDIEISRRAYRKKVQQIKEEDEQLLTCFGIELKTIRGGEDAGELGVFYTKHANVMIKNP